MPIDKAVRSGVLEILLDLSARVFAWQTAAQLTWHIFWTEKVAEARASNPDGSLAEIYQAALQETKTYLRSDSVWNEFHAACQAALSPWLGEACDQSR